MGALRDLSGQRFGKLTVIERDCTIRDKRTKWLCKCDCGNFVSVRSDTLLAGITVSCGCYNKQIHTSHSSSKTRLYRIWHGIKQRCNNTSMPNYMDYGGRGITLCDEWLNYASFREWTIENGWDGNAKRGVCTIERKDNNKGYSPGNCRWATTDEQNKNRRSNHTIVHNGESHILSEWAKIVGLKKTTLDNRINHLGWSISAALTTPLQTKFSHRR